MDLERERQIKGQGLERERKRQTFGEGIMESDIIGQGFRERERVMGFQSERVFVRG